MNQPKVNTHTTILVMVTGFLVLSFIFKAPILVTIATIVALVSLTIPRLGKGIEWVWYKIATVLGWFNTRLLLGFLFFVFLFPVAMLARAFGKANLKLNKPTESIFTFRDHKYTRDDFENMW